MNAIKYLRLALAAISLFLPMVAVACATATIPSSEQTEAASARVIVTHNFGQELVLDRIITTGDQGNAMAALQQVARIETVYGGGFVNSIDGVSSKYVGRGARQDWFFYINGMESYTGALDSLLYPGDVEQWDFHDWSFHQSIPAVTGTFPEPFNHGRGGKIRPTVIAYAADLKEAAAGLQKRLTFPGITAATCKSMAELSNSEKESVNLVLLGTPDNQLIGELNRNWKRLGFFAYFEKSKLVSLNANGQVQTQYEAGTGLIQATQNPWNPGGIGAAENVVWLVSGTDLEGTKAAVATLVNQFEDLKYTFAVVVSNGKIVKLPQ